MKHVVFVSDKEMTDALRREGGNFNFVSNPDYTYFADFSAKPCVKFTPRQTKHILVCMLFDRFAELATIPMDKVQGIEHYHDFSRKTHIIYWED